MLAVYVLSKVQDKTGRSGRSDRQATSMTAVMHARYAVVPALATRLHNRLDTSPLHTFKPSPERPRVAPPPARKVHLGEVSHGSSTMEGTEALHAHSILSILSIPASPLSILFYQEVSCLWKERMVNS